MKTLSRRAIASNADERGAALLLAILLLFVLVAITIQISVTTGTDARTARNDVSLGAMDLSIESALLKEFETLKSDADNASASPSTGTTPTTPATTPAATPAAGAPAGGQAAQGACDSRRDEWATVQRSEINEIKLRVFVQDEDSKYNILNMLNPDEKVAKDAFDRVVRIIDLCREGTRGFDIDARTAEEMAKAMLAYMKKRHESKVPQPKLLTDPDEKSQDETGLPLTLEEFAAIAPFEEMHFRDLKDADGKVVHSLGTFLTVWSSVGRAGDVVPATIAAATNAANAAGKTTSGTTPTSGAAGSSAAGTSGSSSTPGSGSSGSASSASSSSSSQAGGAQAGGAATGGAAGATGTAAGGAGGSSSNSNQSGGWSVNVNTAPVAVLKGLFDDRDVYPRVWDKIVEYRNLEEEEDKTKADQTPEEKDKDIQLDEYGQEIIKRRIFDSLAKLSDVDEFKGLPTDEQTKITQMLTVESHVFSIYVVARKATNVDGDTSGVLDAQEQRKLEESAGDSLVRVVRCVVWRHKVDEDTVITPIVRWQVLDYLPYEVLDFPPENR